MSAIIELVIGVLELVTDVIPFFFKDKKK